MTEGRKSQAASTISSSIPRAWSSTPWCTAPGAWTAMGCGCSLQWAGEGQALGRDDAWGTAEGGAASHAPAGCYRLRGRRSGLGSGLATARLSRPAVVRGGGADLQLDGSEPFLVTTDEDLWALASPRYSLLAPGTPL